MRARILFSASLCLATILVASAAQPPGEKVKPIEPEKDPPKITAFTEINGKTLDEWIKFIPSRDRSQTELAVESIMLYGPEIAYQAVPALIAELKKHTPTAPIDLSVRVAIPPALALIVGSVAKPNPQDVTETVAVLRKMVVDPQIIVKIRATQALGRMGPMAKDAVPDLVKIANDTSSPTWEARHSAVAGLGFMAYDPKNLPNKSVSDALVARISDSAIKVRLAALQSLSMLRAHEDPAVKPKLQAALQNMANSDPDPIGKIRANLSLFQMLNGPPNAKARATIVAKVASFLTHEEAHVRMDAAQTLGAFGPEAKEHGPDLIKRLKDKELAVMGWSMWALGQMQYVPAVPFLQQIVADPNVPEQFRDTAKDAISEIQGTKKKADPK